MNSSALATLIPPGGRSHVQSAAPQFDAPADASFLGVVIATADGELLDANANALQLLGLTGTDFLEGGLSWRDLLCPSSATYHCDNACLPGQSAAAPPVETLFRKPDGTTVSLLTGAMPLAGDSNRCLLYLIDISDRKRQQAEHDQTFAREQSARVSAESDVQRLESILSVTDTALALLDSNDFLSEILARVRSSLRADTATVWLIEDDGRHLVAAASQGIESEGVYQQRVPLGQGVVGRVAATRLAVNLEDIARQEAGNLFAKEQIHSVLATPLLVTGKGAKVIGVLSVGTTQIRSFSEPEARLLDLVASRVATAIERSRLFEQVRSAQDQLESLSRRVLEVQENERRHIARELHDDIGQSLTAVKIGLLALGNAPAEAPAILSEALATVDAAIARVRNLSRDLRPAVLDDLGLAAALRWLMRGQPPGAPECHVEAPEDSRFSVQIETVCFRVAQEAVTNALRHATAQNIWIRLHMSKGALTLSITDDGSGFDVEAAQERIRQGDSLGLLNMEERVRLVGGRFLLLSKPGRGTKIRAVFSLRTLTAEGPVDDAG